METAQAQVKFHRPSCSVQLQNWGGQRIFVLEEHQHRDLVELFFLKTYDRRIFLSCNRHRAEWSKGFKEGQQSNKCESLDHWETFLRLMFYRFEHWPISVFARTCLAFRSISKGFKSLLASARKKRDQHQWEENANDASNLDLLP